MNLLKIKIKTISYAKIKKIYNKFSNKIFLFLNKNVSNFFYTEINNKKVLKFRKFLRHKFNFYT